MLLSKGEATTQKQLSEQLYLEKSSVSRLLDGLEKKGWLERQPDPEDSRRKRVIPTERALAEASRCSAIANAVLSDVQQGIAADDLEQGQSVLNQVIGNLRDLNG